MKRNRLALRYRSILKNGIQPPFVRPRMSFGDRVGGIGDGLTSPTGGVGSGPNNFMQEFCLALRGKLRPVTSPALGMSGSRIQNSNGTQTAWIPTARAMLKAMRPGLWINYSMGHNDTVLSTDPAISTWFTDWCEETLAAYQDFVSYAGPNQYFVAVGTIPSNSDDPTYRAAAWAAQAAFVQNLIDNDYRVIFQPTTMMLPPSDYSIDTSSTFTHSDARAVKLLIAQILAKLADVLPIQTMDDVVAAIKAGSYPGMGSGNLDSLSSMATTGGTVSGSGISIGGDGQLPGGKTVISGMVGPTIVVERVAKGDGSYKIRATLNGTVTTAGKLMLQDLANQPRTASPGRYFRHGCRFKSTKGGFTGKGADWGGGTFGTYEGNANALTQNNLCGINTDPIDDIIFWVLGYPTYGSDTAFTGKRAWALHWPVGTVFNNDVVEWDFPFTFEASDRGSVPAAYLGNSKSVGGTVQTFYGSNYRARLSGSYSAASGGTVRMETGIVLPEGLTNADFVERRIYAGASTDTAKNSGTKIHTFTNPAQWSIALAGGLAIAGQILWGEYDLKDPTTGTIITVRTELTSSLTVAA